MNNKVKDYGLGVKIVFYVLSIIFAIVLLGNVIRIAFGTGTFTFTAFLEYISKSPQVDMTYIELWNLGGSWGILDPLRNFFNSFSSILSFIIWLGKSLVNGLAYLFYFVRFLLV